MNPLFFKFFFLNSFFEVFFLKLSFLKLSFLGGGFDEKSFLAFFITNDKRACQKQAIILKMKKSFLAFLVLFSRKLDATLNDSF
ncbi:hypothetical protein [Helicobacter pylori]|uniref:hypothetical protein n=1 Tax=Helicobacter pylori TaxID=210 RepID=UPI00398E8B51